MRHMSIDRTSMQRNHEQRWMQQKYAFIDTANSVINGEQSKAGKSILFVVKVGNSDFGKSLIVHKVILTMYAREFTHTAGCICKVPFS